MAESDVDSVGLDQPLNCGSAADVAAGGDSLGKGALAA